MRIAGTLNQLRGYTHAVTFAFYRTLNQGIDIQLLCNFWHRLLRSLISHRRGARDDTQSTDLGQLGSQFFSHAIGEILLFRVAGEIFQRQYGQRVNAGSGGAMEYSVAEAADVGSEQSSCKDPGGEHAVNPQVKSPAIPAGLPHDRSIQERRRGVRGKLRVVIQSFQVRAHLRRSLVAGFAI